MTDLELQRALAKLLPDKLGFTNHLAIYWIDGEESVLDTEWLHICWLVEQNIYEPEKTKYVNGLARNSGDLDWSMTHASWQQRARAILAVKGIKK